MTRILSDSRLPLIDRNTPEQTEVATFSLGCFWSPDALFGSTPGVIRTRVGYAGGTTSEPNYKYIGDHTETIHMDFNPDQISYKEPTHSPYKGQYMSALFYHNQGQKKMIDVVKEKFEEKWNKKINTEIIPYSKFYLAEDYHQKYKLQRQKELTNELREIYPSSMDFINSTATARINGYLDKFGKKEQLINDIDHFGLSETGKFFLLETVSRFLL